LTIYRSVSRLDTHREEGTVLRGKRHLHERKQIYHKREELHHKRQELCRIQSETKVANKQRAKQGEHLGNFKRKIIAQQEIFRLERELLQLERKLPATTDEKRTEREELGTGALPDFVIIGAKKAGTNFLYHLLTLHPHVEPAAGKELHYFGLFFDKGTEWYRQCFPQPRWQDGQRTITGEASPCMGNPVVPKRMAEVIPQARLIALLRNPVDRAYSDYHHEARRWETRTFEEALGVERPRPLGTEEKTPDSEARNMGLDGTSQYLSGGVYVDQLLRWSRFFGKEQMLVLKSEDLYEHPTETLRVVLSFLDVADWEPEAAELNIKRNEGRYEQKMKPDTRRRLEEYFEPHNRRLYEYLGVDFGW
jgi:hypothetical protein